MVFELNDRNGKKECQRFVYNAFLMLKGEFPNIEYVDSDQGGTNFYYHRIRFRANDSRDINNISKLVGRWDWKCKNPIGRTDRKIWYISLVPVDIESYGIFNSEITKIVRRVYKGEFFDLIEEN